MIEPTPPGLPAHARTPAFAGAVAPGWALLRAGRIRRAADEVHRLLRADVAATLSDPELALALLLQVDLDLGAGEVATATGRLGRIRDLEGDAPALVLALASGETAAAYGDHAEAAEQFLAAGDLPGADEVLIRPWWVGGALALVRTGRRHEGADLAREQVQRAEAAGDTYALAHGLRVLATAETGHDRVGTLHRAQQLAALSGCHRLAAQLDTDVAALAILSPGRPDAEIAQRLRSAEAYTGQEGLWPLHTRVVALLARMGEPARPLVGRALELLTPAEQRVARLAAQQLTNRQIATELGVSIKGVEWHLSRVYRKLGISSRDALAGLLTEDGADAAE